MNKEQHAANIAAINARQFQRQPLLAESVFFKSKPYDIMLIGSGKLSTMDVSFVCVKGRETWALYYSYGSHSPEYVATNGHKASINQTLNLIAVEGDLIELYRK